jgi:hypothetical protein
MKVPVSCKIDRIEGVGDESQPPIDVSVASDPKKWAAKSRELWRCADLLSEDKSAWLVAWMLYGLALEMALKAHLLGWKQGPLQGSPEARLVEVTKCRHNLIELAGLVMGPGKDERLAKHLQFAMECVEWRAKYPSPSASQLKKSREWKSITLNPRNTLHPFLEFLLRKTT